MVLTLSIYHYSHSQQTEGLTCLVSSTGDAMGINIRHTSAASAITLHPWRGTGEMTLARGSTSFINGIRAQDFYGFDFCWWWSRHSHYSLSELASISTFIMTCIRLRGRPRRGSSSRRWTDGHSENMELAILTPDRSIATSPIINVEPRRDPHMQEVVAHWGCGIESFDDEGNSLGFEAQPIPAGATRNRSQSPTQEGLDGNHSDVHTPSPLQSIPETRSPGSSSCNSNLTGGELLHLLFETHQEVADLKYKMEKVDQRISLLVAMHAHPDLIRTPPSLSGQDAIILHVPIPLPACSSGVPPRRQLSPSG